MQEMENNAASMPTDNRTRQFSLERISQRKQKVEDNIFTENALLQLFLWIPIISVKRIATRLTACKSLHIFAVPRGRMQLRWMEEFTEASKWWARPEARSRFWQWMSKWILQACITHAYIAFDWLTRRAVVRDARRRCWYREYLHQHAQRKERRDQKNLQIFDRCKCSYNCNAADKDRSNQLI